MTMAADPISLPPPQAPDFIPHAQADAAPTTPAAPAAPPMLIPHAPAPTRAPAAAAPSAANAQPAGDLPETNPDGSFNWGNAAKNVPERTENPDVTLFKQYAARQADQSPFGYNEGPNTAHAYLKSPAAQNALVDLHSGQGIEQVMSGLRPAEQQELRTGLARAINDDETKRINAYINAGHAEDYPPAAEKLLAQAKAQYQANPESSPEDYARNLYEGFREMPSASFIRDAVAGGESPTGAQAKRFFDYARRDAHPWATALGQGTAALVSPENIAALALTGGISSAVAPELAGASRLAAGAARTGIGAGVFGGKDTLAQAIAGQDLTPVRNILQNAVPFAAGEALAPVGQAISRGIGGIGGAVIRRGVAGAGGAAANVLGGATSAAVEGKPYTGQEAAQQAILGAGMGALAGGNDEAQHALAGRLAADFPDLKGGDAHALAQRLLAAGITPENYDKTNLAGAGAAAAAQIRGNATPMGAGNTGGARVSDRAGSDLAENGQKPPLLIPHPEQPAQTIKPAETDTQVINREKQPLLIPHAQENGHADEITSPAGLSAHPPSGDRGPVREGAAEQGGGQAEAQEQPGAAGGREVAQLSGVGVKGSVAPGDSATPTGGGSKYGRSAPEQPLQSNPARDEGKIKQEFSQRAISDKLIGWLNARDEARGAGDNGEPIVLHPDALDGIGGKGRSIEAKQSQALRMRLSKFVDEDKWSEMTQDMNAQQISRLERSMLSRAMQTTETKSDKVARAIKEAKASDDPRAQFLAHYMENKPTMGQHVPKEWLDVGKLTEDDAGKTFEIHGEKFRVDVDDAGKVILRDHVTYEHPEELGKIPIDKGTWPGEEPELPEGEFAPEETKTTGQQLGLLGERSAGGITGSKTASMFGDVRRGAASKLEEQPEPTALERKFSGTKSGELPGMGELPAADKAKGELDVGDKFPFPGAKANDKYPAVADVRMTLDGQRQYKVKFSEKTEPQWMPSPRPFNPGEDIGQRGLSEGPPGAMQVKPIAKASAEPEQGTLANMRDRFLGALAVRGRYLPLARRMGADIAQAFTRRANEPTSLTDDAHLAFTREAFGGKDDAAAQETKARWWQLGQAIRGINAQEKAQARNPDLTPEELDSLWTGPKMTREEINTAMADPAMKKAADIWNEKYSPTLSAIRQKHGLLMDPLVANRERFPFFINMPTEFEGPAGTDTSAQAGNAFNRKFGGTGNYENDPDEGIRAIFRGHFTTDATQDLANLIRTRYSSRMPDDVLQANGYTDTIAGKKTNLQQIDLGEKPEAMARARFATKAMLDSQAATARWGELNAGNPKEAAIKQSAKVAMEKAKDQAEMARRMAEAAKSDKVWVPEDVASEWDRLKRPHENRDTLYDKINGAWQRVATTFTFPPHIARVASLAASRLARTGQISTPSDVLRFLPSWLGSNELALAQAHGMNGMPWGSAMQYLIDSWGANRAIGHGAEGETRGGILNFGHRVLFDPESGADILARRVVGETYLRQVLGNATVDNLQRAVSSGKISALEAFRHFRNRLSPDQAIDAGQYVNGTLGFSNYRTRSGLLNALQRGGVPFIGSESGMIPADMARIGSMGLNPRMLWHMVKDGRIKQAAVGASAVLGSGALGLYAAMNGLNYMNTLAQTGSGRFMWQNDPGHRNDLWLGLGVHLGNIDASVSRGERLMGLQDQLGKKGTLSAKQTAQDAAFANVNESAETLAPHLKVAFELLTRIAGHPSTLYFEREAHGGGISLRKAKWGDSVPAIPNIVDALTDKHVNAQSVPAAAAQDLAKDTLGTKLSFGH